MSVQTAPHSKPQSLFFTDARSCKDWLKTVPITNFAQAQHTVLDALRLMNRSPEVAPIERLTCMELMRDKVAFLLSEQRTRYALRTIPLIASDYAAWNISRQLLAEMEAGYRRCWNDASGEDSPLVAHAALIVQRIIRYIGLQMLMSGFIYRPFDQALWMRLHMQWMEAEGRNLVDKSVKDSIGTIDGYSSVQQAYTAVLLGQLSNVHELMPRQIDFVDAVLKRFGHKVTVRRETAPNAQGLNCAVDLLANVGCGFHPHVAPAEHVRMLDTEELSRSLRRRIKKLAEGEEPGHLDLPSDWSAQDAREQLIRLHKLWCEGAPLRPAATIPDETDAILSFGIAETHFFLYGDLFEQPGVKREMTRQEMNDIQMFGKVAESTIRAKYADFNYGSETWKIVDESRGYVRLLRPPNSPRGVAIGKLVGIKIGKQGTFYLGVMRELLEETEGIIIVTVAMLPGKPEATAVRPGDPKARSSSNYVQGFRLPPNESLKLPEMLVVPAGMVKKGGTIDIFHPGHGSPKQVTLSDFVERGADFDRVTIV
jgi:hypothetical protein